jgi:hypothetical protein
MAEWPISHRHLIPNDHWRYPKRNTSHSQRRAPTRNSRSPSSSSLTSNPFSVSSDHVDIFYLLLLAKLYCNRFLLVAIDTVLLFSCVWTAIVRPHSHQSAVRIRVGLGNFENISCFRGLAPYTSLRSGFSRKWCALLASVSDLMGQGYR